MANASPACEHSGPVQATIELIIASSREPLGEGSEGKMARENEGSVWAGVVAVASVTTVIGLLYLPPFPVAGACVGSHK